MRYKMDKQKQINFLGNCLYDLQEEYDMSNPFEVAKIIINAGYRKIPEGAVVVSKQVWEEHIENWDKTTKAVKERASKETAEKFAERLKADVSEDNELHIALNYYLKRDYFEYIDEIAKEIANE